MKGNNFWLYSIARSLLSIGIQLEIQNKLKYSSLNGVEKEEVDPEIEKSFKRSIQIIKSIDEKYENEN